MRKVTIEDQVKSLYDEIRRIVDEFRGQKRIEPFLAKTQTGWDLNSSEHECNHIDIKDVLEAKPLREWRTKDFLDYFVIVYRKATDKNFISLCSRDIVLIDNIMRKVKRYIINKSNVNEYVKGFIDWVFSDKERASTIISISDMNKFFDEYNKIEKTKEEADLRERDIISELAEEKRNGLEHLLVHYGIPIVATFLKYRCNKNEEEIEHAIATTLKNIAYRKDIDSIKDIGFNSINCSPYPQEFIFTDWRGRFGDYWEISGCKRQSWWRDIDLQGNIRSEYYSIIQDNTANEEE